MLASYLKLLGIVHPRDGLHQVRCGVVAEVGADVADAQASAAGLQVLWVLVGRFVQGVNLRGRAAILRIKLRHESRL